MEKRDIRTLKQFYDLMDETRVIRAGIVKTIFNNEPVKHQNINELETALSMLENIPAKNGRVILLLDGVKTIETELTYETGELKKDLWYLENGEEKFHDFLDKLHPGFRQAVEAGAEKLKGIEFNNFITDRDGTINNYCGRYKSSIQSIWNSVFLTRFARECASNSVIITSAPLSNPGILDVSINPEKTFIYAASKAREYVDSGGARHTYPVSERQQKKLDELNRELSALVAKPEYEKYSLIGSGLQFKFGQTTIARQDISGSIPKNESNAFGGLVNNLVGRLDPRKEWFRIEDTGYDIEILLTVKGNETEGSLKDFDKSNGIDYLDGELNLAVKNGPNLICGDTSSDLCMIEMSMSRTSDTWTVFVTRDENLAEKARGLCPNNHIVAEPDMLVAILNKLSIRG